MEKTNPKIKKISQQINPGENKKRYIEALEYFNKTGNINTFIIASSTGKDLIASWGYKKSIVNGLVFSAIGAIAMIAAVQLNTFYGMLIGLFID